jgi:hypothetical protein
VIDWPKTVVDDIARRRSVIFVGSGISKQAQNAGGQRPKTWKEFLEAALVVCPHPLRHIKTLIGAGDYLTACEIIKAKMGDEFDRFVYDQFAAPGFQAAKIHTDIVRLDSRIVATPNFDKIYDTEAQLQLKGNIRVKHYYDGDIGATLRGDDFVIIKVHGTVDYPSKLIFTRQQYTNARYEYDQFYAMLDALALTHTFVFLGAGLSDPDIRLLLENHAYRYPNSRPHVMATPRGESHTDVQKITEKSLNIKLITYDPANGHKELADSIEQLVALVDDARAKLALSQKW